MLIHRIAFSPNVERVALALAYKGLAAEWVDHDPNDRSKVQELSGQDLVPIAELNGEVIADSMRIVDRLETLAPEPPLYPLNPAARAKTLIFIEWFNEVWKRPPNAIDEEERRPNPDRALIAGLSARMRGWLSVFEGLLADGDYLIGDDFTAADVCAFPFVKYSVIPRDAADNSTFRRVLEMHQRLDNRCPRLGAWIARMNARPRA
jgi:glutathione S-transferase